MNHHVIIADTDKSFVQLITPSLEFNDFSVSWLQDISGLTVILDRQPAAVVVADIMMPKMNLMQCTDYIAGERNIPMIITGIKELGNAERKQLLTHGIPFIKKPFIPRILCEKIKEMVR